MWNYDNAFERHPVQNGTAVFENGSRLKVHDIKNPLPSFMHKADLLFVDPPWNKGNLRSFYTKADQIDMPWSTYSEFYTVLFERIREIKPKICYAEIGKEGLADFIIAMRSIYPYVTFYNSSYYHKVDNHCYVVRGSRKASKPRLDGIDEEDIIEWICKNEDYNCIADPCMGRGLVAINAYKNGQKFVGTELNHKRLSVALESLASLGAKYHIEED